MARPKKETVDYFPHFTTSGKTMYVLETTYGNDGYAFWFKVLELLGSTEGHYYDCNNIGSWRFLVAKTRVDENVALDILNMLSDLEAIDSELWDHKLIWSDNFVKNIAPVYSNRRTDLPQKPIITSRNNTPSEFLQVDTDLKSNATKKTRQSIVEYSKVKESIVKDSKVDETIVNKTIVNDSINVANAPTTTNINNINYDNILHYWNNHSSLKEIQAITDKRKEHINARIKDYGLDAIYEVINKCGASDFLQGKGKDRWVANFDWVFRPTNFLKVLEGNYDNPSSKRKVPDWHKEYERELKQYNEKQSHEVEVSMEEHKKIVEDLKKVWS